MAYIRKIENVEIRQKLKVAGIPFWVLGRQIGVTDMTISRWLREPLSEEKRKMIESAISELLGE